MGGILFKFFMYYLLYRMLMTVIQWLYEEAIPAACEALGSFIHWAINPPSPEVVRHRERCKAEWAKELARREADITTAEGWFKDAQRRNAATAEFNRTRWERAGQGHLNDGSHSFSRGSNK